MTIGEKIKWAREKIGWDSIEYMAAYAYLEVGRAKEIEAGQGDEIKMSELVRIADALHRPVEWFMSEDEPDDPPMLHCKLSETSGMADET